MSRIVKFSLGICMVALGVRVLLLDAAMDGLSLVAWSAGLVALVGWIRGGRDA
jgi:hypothetical protein